MEENLKLFVDQVSGHSSFLQMDPRTVAKMLRPREHHFYLHTPAPLLPFIPEYRGVADVWLDIDKDGMLVAQLNPGSPPGIDPPHTITNISEDDINNHTNTSQDHTHKHTDNIHEAFHNGGKHCNGIPAQANQNDPPVRSKQSVDSNSRSSELPGPTADKVVEEEFAKEASDSIGHTVSQVESSVLPSIFQQDPNSMNCVDIVPSACSAGSAAPKEYSAGSVPPQEYSAGSAAPQDYSAGSVSHEYSAGSASPKEYSAGSVPSQDYSAGSAPQGYSAGSVAPQDAAPGSVPQDYSAGSVVQDSAPVSVAPDPVPARPAGSVPPPGHAPAPAVPAVTHQQKADPWMALVQDGHSDGGGAGAQNLWYLRCYHKQAHALREQQLVPAVHQYLMMENLVLPYRRPCILDIKMGTRLYDRSHSAARRQVKAQIAERTTSKELGFRISGVQIHTADSGEVECLHKKDGEALTAAGVRQLLAAFTDTHDELKACLVSSLLRKLKALHNVVDELSGVSMLCSSLLLIYEGDSICQNNNVMDKDDSAQGDTQLLDDVCGCSSSPSCCGGPTHTEPPTCCDYHPRQGDSYNSPTCSSTGQEANHFNEMTCDAPCDKLRVSVKMIDFAHVEFLTEEKTVNDGYLYGLKNLIREFQDIQVGK